MHVLIYFYFCLFILISLSCKSKSFCWLLQYFSSINLIHTIVYILIKALQLIAAHFKPFLCFETCFRILTVFLVKQTLIIFIYIKHNLTYPIHTISVSLFQRSCFFFVIILENSICVIVIKILFHTFITLIKFY